MSNKDYRELQLSSSQLVLIFLGILILGIVIFILGVSVGKKQAQLVKESQTSADKMLEQVKDEKPLPVQEQKESASKELKDSISKELASHQKIKEETQEQTPVVAKQNLYYIQVGAFRDKNAAFSIAESYKIKGYDAIVLNPLPSDKKAIYRVRIGGFNTREQAVKIKAELIKSEGKKKSDYFIIKD